MTDEIKFFEQVNRNFDRAAYLDHPSGLLEQVKTCNGVYHVTFALEREDGSIEVIHAWRAERTQPQPVAGEGGYPLRPRRERGRGDGFGGPHDLQQVGTRFHRNVFDRLVAGAEKEDLVNSGLEETMVVAYEEIRETAKEHGEGVDLRTAAYIRALDKVAADYPQLGIFT